MTGRELIVYILNNKLEDKQIFKDGELLGTMNSGFTARFLETGVETIRVYLENGTLDGFIIGNELYIFPNSKFDRMVNNLELFGNVWGTGKRKD